MIKNTYTVLVLFICIFALHTRAYAEDICAKEGAKPQENIFESIKKYHNSRTYILDGEKYTRDRLIMDFMNAAYSRHILKQQHILSNKNHWFFGFFDAATPEKLGKQLKRHPEQFSEYIFRRQGRPKFAVLNRWKKDMRVGLELNDISDQGHHKKLLLEMSPHIQSLSEAISPLSGRKIVFIGEVNDCLADVDICISITDAFSEDNRFKAFKNKETGHYVPISDQGFYSLENFFSDAVQFTPTSKSQVRGYFISDNQNNINFAACQIWPYMDTGMMKALMTECMLRSMGLSDLVLGSNSSALRAWNKAYDAHVSIDFMYGEEQNNLEILLLKSASAEEADDILAKWKKKQEDEKFLAKMKDVKLPELLSDYDRQMLKLLYCSEISAGQDAYQVIHTLYNSGACFFKSL